MYIHSSIVFSLLKIEIGLHENLVPHPLDFLVEWTFKNFMLISFFFF